MCKEMVENNDLLAKTFYPKGDIVIVENQGTITIHFMLEKIWKTVLIRKSN